MKIYGKIKKSSPKIKKRRSFQTMFCEVELCIYNKDYKCTSDIIEIEASGRCYQRMLITEDTLELMSKEALDLIKKELLKNETELWRKRLFNE